MNNKRMNGCILQLNYATLHNALQLPPNVSIVAIAQDPNFRGVSLLIHTDNPRYDAVEGEQYITIEGIQTYQFDDNGQLISTTWDELENGNDN